MVKDREGSSNRDPYRGISLALCLAAVVGTIAVMVDGLFLANPVMLASGIALGLAACLLFGVFVAQSARLKPGHVLSDRRRRHSLTKGRSADEPSTGKREKAPSLFPPLGRDLARLWRSLDLEAINVRSALAFLGASAILLLLMERPIIEGPSLRGAAVGVSLALLAAGLAGMAARYLAQIDSVRFPESLGLCRGARVIAWVMVVAAGAVVLAWLNFESIVWVLYFTILLGDAAICYYLLRTRSVGRAATSFPLDFALLSILGRRPNILASVVDAAEEQIGIDLRSTWALAIVRRSVEPLLISLCFVGWLSTSLTVVSTVETGLVERLGVPRSGKLLEPGLHIHLPWPFDRVYRIPVERVQSVQVGHEGEEAEGPENVLWSVEHAPNEFTLLLGNGRDLITVDATVQYRIVDVHAWQYHSQNPADALRAIAYRAVMRSTVNLTLSEALSQNISILAARMKTMVQKDADDLGLGVQVLAFTVSGMHPPVPVSPAYEGVVSAQLGAATATMNAQSFHVQTVSAAQSEIYTFENTAREDSAKSLATAAGQAWSFRTLESQYRADPGEYLFRRRLETLEKDLPMHSYTVLDARFLRDGGEIWQTP